MRYKSCSPLLKFSHCHSCDHVTNLEVKVEALLQPEPLGEDVVLLHVVGESVVPVCRLALGEED